MIVIDEATHESRNNWIALGALFLVISILCNVWLFTALLGMSARC